MFSHPGVSKYTTTMRREPHVSLHEVDTRGNSHRKCNNDRFDIVYVAVVCAYVCVCVYSDGGDVCLRNILFYRKTIGLKKGEKERGGETGRERERETILTVRKQICNSDEK